MFYGTGKKKTSISRVFIKNGNGNIVINNLNYINYCNNEFKKFFIYYPLNLIKWNNEFDILITVKGGGFSSQLKSIMYGIAKALSKINLNNKKILKINKLLTRDSRIVERKKVGFKKSRKRPQFSKR